MLAITRLRVRSHCVFLSKWSIKITITRERVSGCIRLRLQITITTGILHACFHEQQGEMFSEVTLHKSHRVYLSRIAEMYIFGLHGYILTSQVSVRFDANSLVNLDIKYLTYDGIEH